MTSFVVAYLRKVGATSDPSGLYVGNGRRLERLICSFVAAFEDQFDFF